MNIWVIATLDTKFTEADFIGSEIEKMGHTPIIIDPGSTGIVGIKADITRDEVAIAGGETLEKLLEKSDKAYSQQKMREGLINLVGKYYSKGRIDAVIGIGGGQGTATATAAMQILPIGVPKVMVSTVACGLTTFGPYVGTSDMTMIHSVADIAGLNFITKRILAQATAAVVAMASIKEEDTSEKPLVAITQAGVTTPGTTAVREKLESLGFDIIIFHCNGIGGQAMEDLIRQGVIKGLIDYSPHEITDFFYQGLMPALPGRMTAAGEMGIPQIVGPGCADIRLHLWEKIPDELKDRLYVRHTPTHTHFRTSYDEMYQVGEYIAEHLNHGKGPRAAIVPLKGYSMMNREGKPLYDVDANKGYEDALREKLNDEVLLFVKNSHINDREFADEVVDLFINLWERTKTS